MIDSQDDMMEIVTDLLQFQSSCNKIVAHLIECRKSAGLSQQDLAEWIGSYRMRVARFEKTSNVCDFELMFLIAGKFGVKIKIEHDLS